MQFQKISILPPHEGLEFPGGGGLCKAKKFKVMYEVYLEFPEGWERYGYFLELHILSSGSLLSLKRNFLFELFSTCII